MNEVSGIRLGAPRKIVPKPLQVPVQRDSFQPATATDPLGTGFPLAPPVRRTGAELLHDLLSGRIPNAFGWTSDKILGLAASASAQIGMNPAELLAVEKKMFVTLSPSASGYVSGSLPLFAALGDKMGAYVDIGTTHADDADHLMREWNSLPLSTIEKLGVGNDYLTPVRQTLLDRAHAQDFPVFINTGGNFSQATGTDSIATESIASIAKRENRLGDFPDTPTYFKWLVTRLESQYSHTDPWLYASRRPIHDSIDAIKVDLTPPWLKGNDKDPLGFIIPYKQLQSAYSTYMGLAGNGKTPDWSTLGDIADTTIGLDRDIVSGIQTYWTKFMRELELGQRTSLFQPMVRTWVALNTLAPTDANFGVVSPSDAPAEAAVDTATDTAGARPYDRSLGMSEVLEHSLDGLGIQSRKDLINLAMSTIQERRTDLEAREQRLRNQLGSAYSGLDVDALLDGTTDGSDPKVQKALSELKAAAATLPPASPGYAEATRHRDIMDFAANRSIRYGDVGLQVANLLPGQFDKNPLMVSEFYIGNVSARTGPAPNTPVTPLGQGPSLGVVYGHDDGKPPVPMSIVLKGGGGRGFAFAECLRQVTDSLSKGSGLTAIDEFVGNSAGALTAGLLAGGYSPDELAQVQTQLDFKKFYGDYLWLQGGVDPKVRGVDRTGMFSQQAMYRIISNLLQAKTNVQGRPVLFRDLPFKLKLTSTIINTDLPDDLRKQLGVGPDGQIVFSTENTPNMDVAAAMCESAGVPGFFEASQLQVFRQEAGGVQTYRLQTVDGGVVNNFPIHEVSRQTPDEKQALVVLPTFVQTPDGTELSALDFDPTALQTINAYNDERYAQLLPGLPDFIQKARGDGAERVALGFNLSDMKEQQTPAVQGRNRADTEQFFADAQETGFQSLNPVDSAKAASSAITFAAPKLNYAELQGLNLLLGVGNVFEPHPNGKSVYNIPQNEALNLSDMAGSVLAANIVGGQQLPNKAFEQG